VKHGGTAEVYAMPFVDAVLQHHRVLRLLKIYVPHMLVMSSLNRSPSLSYVYFTTFTWKLVHTRDLQTQINIGRSQHVYLLPSWEVNSPDVINISLFFLEAY
jgi:hypothetical protein